MLSLFELTAILLFLCASFSVANHTLLRLPTSVGLLVLGTLASVLLIAVRLILPGSDLFVGVEDALRQIDLTAVIFNGMLALLLFAGALNVNFSSRGRLLGQNRLDAHCRQRSLLLRLDGREPAFAE